MKKSEVSLLLAEISAAFPNFHVTNETHRVWLEHLKTQTFAVCRKALAEYIAASNTEWAPSVSQLLHRVAQATQQPEAKLTFYEARDLNTEYYQRAFQLWGGARRWATLPDPLYTGKSQDQRTLDFALRDIENIYNDQKARATAQHAIDVRANGAAEVTKLVHAILGDGNEQT